MLTRHFLKHSARQLGVEPKRISDAALQTLMRFTFPGNVRQLENICHWLTVMAPAQVIAARDLPPEVLQNMPAPAAEPQPATELPPPLPPQAAPTSAAGTAPVAAAAIAAHAVAECEQGWDSALELEARSLLQGGQPQVWDVLSRRFESCLIRTALQATHGRRMEAAQRLGIGRNTITRKIQELGLDAQDDE
jgi:two-component system nitrogen regulation response regulator GlnG